MTPHKHAEVLRAIADGKEVQYRQLGDKDTTWWVAVHHYNPLSYPDFEWRARPEKKKAWINIYPKGEHVNAQLHPDKATAEFYRGGLKVVACIEIEYEEGQGL